MAIMSCERPPFSASDYVASLAITAGPKARICRLRHVVYASSLGSCRIGITSTAISTY